MTPGCAAQGASATVGPLPGSGEDPVCGGGSRGLGGTALPVYLLGTRAGGGSRWQILTLFE